MCIFFVHFWHENKVLPSTHLPFMVFITGVNGLVGSFVAREFLRHGHAVRALRRPDSDLGLLQDIAGQIEWIEGDILDVPLLAQAIRPGDIVVHSAAIVSYAPARQREMFRTNVEGTANLVNVCLEKNVKKFCFVSSVAALGRGKDSVEINENGQWQESSLNAGYAKTKHLAELEVWRAAAEGLRAVAVNPSVVLGPGDLRRSSTQLFGYALAERKFYPAGSVNYVDARDVASAVFLLANSEITGERFILNAGTVSYRDLLAQIARRFGKRPPPWLARPWMAQVAWRMEKLKTLFTRHEPLITRETARLSQSHYVFRNDKIKKELGFTFRTLDESLDWTCAGLKGSLPQRHPKEKV